MDELQVLSVCDCNGVLIETNGLVNARDFFIKAASANERVAFGRECKYIKAVGGLTEQVDDSGKSVIKTDLQSGKFNVLTQVFLDQCAAWYNLKHLGKEWYSENKPVAASWVKQKVQAALVPFGIPEREISSLYKLLLIRCSSMDSVSEPLAIVSSAALNEKVYAKPPFIVDGFLCAGLTLLAAPPKTGKSFLALDLACCVAEGKPFWGFNTDAGSVLYCDLEGTEWRTQERFPAVGRKGKTDCPELLSMVYKVAPVDAGLIQQLEGWINTTLNPKLIIIDTFQHVKGRVARGEDAYAADTRFTKPLHDLAVAHGIAIICITHTRKSSGFALDDPFDAVIGSTAQYGNSDAGWIISGKRDENKKQFTAVGRDFEGVSFEIERSKGGRWIFHGTTEAAQEAQKRMEYQKDPAVKVIKQQLTNNGGSWKVSPQEFLNIAAIGTGEYLAPDALRMGKRLRELQPLLLKYDNIITCLPEAGGRKGRCFFFEQMPFTEQ